MTAPEKTRRNISTAKRAAALVNIKKAWAAQRSYPICNATRRTDGGKCGNLGLANGRCRLHGGQTPKGKDWHKVQLTNPGQSIEQLDKKEREVARRRAKQAARVAAMTPEQRARYDAWHAARQPGDKSKRARRRDDLTAKAVLSSAGLKNAGLNQSPEFDRLAEMIRRLEGSAARMKDPRPDSDDQGDIFA